MGRLGRHWDSDRRYCEVSIDLEALIEAYAQYLIKNFRSA